MKPAKLWPSPTGSMKTKRALPAGMETKSRATAFCKMRSPSARRSGGASIRSDMRSGAPRNAGTRQGDVVSTPVQASSAAVGRAPGTSLRFKATSPTRITGNGCNGGCQESQPDSSHGRVHSRSASCNSSNPLVMVCCAVRHAACAAAVSANSSSAASRATDSQRCSSSASATVRRSLTSAINRSRSRSVSSIAIARCLSALAW